MAYDLTAVLRLKDQMTDKIKKATESISKMRNQTEQASSSLSQIRGVGAGAFAGITTGASGAIAKVTALTAAVGGLATAYKGVESTIGGAMRLEQEMISMEHFMGLTRGAEEAKKAAQDYMEYLRKNAIETPFEQNEVISAGRRSLQVAGGDIKQAEQMLKIAQDMAALNPAKTLEQAMEALADMAVGETERMKEFGFKISAEEMKKAGGGDVVKGAFQIMNTEVAKTFDGGAKKLAESGKGLMSQITGTIQGKLADAGMEALERMKPTLEKIGNWLESGGADGFFKGVSNFLANAVDWSVKLFGVLQQVKAVASTVLTPISKGIKSLIKTEEFQGVIESIKNGITSMVSIVQARWTNMSENFNKYKPVIGAVFNALGSAIDAIVQAVQVAFPIIQDIWTTVFNAIAPLIQKVANTLTGLINGVVKPLLPVIGIALTVVWNIVKPIFNGIMSLINGVASVISFLVNNVAAPLFTVLSTVITTLWSVISPILSLIKTAFGAIGHIIKECISSIAEPLLNKFGGFVKGAWETASPFFDKIKDGFRWVGDKIQWVIEMINDFKAKFDQIKNLDFNIGLPKWLGGDGLIQVESKKGKSHASGLSYVPYNGYQATLHKGERVLTPEENKEYTSGSRSVNIAKLAETIVVREEADIEKIAKALAKEISRAGALMANV
ncbi:phage tail protein [Fredinandcohnia humi]